MSANVSHCAPVGVRVTALDLTMLLGELDIEGTATIPGLLSPEECSEIAGLYDEDSGFRSRVVMAHHGFGRGEYRYFAYPLPTPVEALRASLYSQLVPLANRWNAAMGIEVLP